MPPHGYINKLSFNGGSPRDSRGRAIFYVASGRYTAYMAEREQLYLDRQHREALTAAERRENADNRSDAAKSLIQAGAERKGYWNGTAAGRGVKRLAAEFGRAFAWIGIAILALTVFAPVEFRWPAVFAFFAAFGCSALYVAADTYEERLDRALRRLRRKPATDGGERE